MNNGKIIFETIPYNTKVFALWGSIFIIAINKGCTGGEYNFLECYESGSNTPIWSTNVECKSLRLAPIQNNSLVFIYIQKNYLPEKSGIYIVDMKTGELRLEKQITENFEHVGSIDDIIQNKLVFYLYGINRSVHLVIILNKDNNTYEKSIEFKLPKDDVHCYKGIHIKAGIEGYLDYEGKGIIVFPY